MKALKELKKEIDSLFGEFDYENDETRCGNGAIEVIYDVSKDEIIFFTRVSTNEYAALDDDEIQLGYIEGAWFENEEALREWCEERIIYIRERGF